MSLESALEEERLEILKLLERPQRRSPPHPSGPYSTPASPRQTYSSLVRTASPQRQVTSLIDTIAVSPPSATPTHSSKTSPTSSLVEAPGVSVPSGGIHRTKSDASAQAQRMLGRSQPAKNSTDAYDFTMLPTVSVPVLGGQPRKRSSQLSLQHDNGAGLFPRRSKSPLPNAAYHHVNHTRGVSPGTTSSGRVSSPPPPVQLTGNKIVNDKGEIIDLGRAYARLSDAALAASGGTLAQLPERRPVVDKDGSHVRAGTGESLTDDGGVRLQKDLDSDSGMAVADSSDEDPTDDESGGSVSEEERRGRSRGSSLIDSTSEGGSRGNSSDGDPPGGKKKGKKDGSSAKMGKKKRIMSLLAAAEEERKQVSSKYNVRSLLPSMPITPSNQILPGASSPTTARRSGVHPSTNFDVPSQTSTPVSSDQEADDIDIRKAQRMETSISPILSSPENHRVFRTVLRGDVEGVWRQIEEKGKRTRKYLVATDLSSEAQHAMEWTIGTVLRDGDTLMAICAVDHDTVEDGSKPVTESSIGDAVADFMNQAQATAGGLRPIGNYTTAHLPGNSSPLALKEGVEVNRERTKAERERFIGAEAITALVTKLLKKTRLQVKVVVEVIHCKSPKHLLTEIIDLVEPTLVILGSRGRSALKGVLLGSFSNYLVAKSSVPVMVARKKLKHTKKYSQTNIRLSNNLTSNSARILANAKVD